MVWLKHKKWTKIGQISIKVMKSEVAFNYDTKKFTSCDWNQCEQFS